MLLQTLVMNNCCRARKHGLTVYDVILMVFLISDKVVIHLFL